MTPQFAPGIRVEIRDAEWRIKRVDYSQGGYVLTCEGLSELVQGREALFLTALEDIRILAPEDTELVDDTSGNFGASLLYIDSMLRKTAPSDDKLHLGHRGAFDPLNFQLQPALQALQQPRQRILIADAVGLGKTLEAGVLTSELIARGRGKRILVLAVKSMLAQFQQEFWTRFTIPLVRLDSVGLQRVRNRIPANHNPFHYFDRSIISIDTLKQDIEYRHYLENAYWDIIIIDEAHNVADRGTQSQRAKLAKLLATRSDTLIMLSATPHDGKSESFASLVNMLDPTAIANPKDYAQEDFKDKGLVIRRFKKDVREELNGNFPDRVISIARTEATPVEDEVYGRLLDVSFHTLDGRGQGAGQLFRTTLEKALFSSPAACLSTVRNRQQRLEKRLQRVRDDEQQTNIIDDLDSLQGLELALQAVKPAQFSKYQLLKETIRDMGWTGSDPEDRLVIFTESLVTLDFLNDHLPGELKLKKGAVALLRGDMPDRELMDTVEQFNRRESPIRLLLCSDVASEGINLHHLSHRMIHFDIPWSLMVFQQRNGRIDRYGQTRQPDIRYLLTDSTHPKIRGDQRILEILVQKDEQAGKNIGDPSEFMGVYDSEAEVEEVARAMESNTDAAAGFDMAAAFDAMLDSQLTESENPLDAFTPEPPASPGAVDADTTPLFRVFPDGLEYARAAQRWFAERGESVQWGIEGDIFWLTPPSDLQQRLNVLPREAQPASHELRLTTRVEAIQQALITTRQEEESQWPDLHYLWPIHPVMEWLSDRALNAFGRHTAPVLRLPGQLEAEEHVVLIHGGFPNRRGHVLIQRWLGVHLMAGQVQATLDWPELQKRYRLYPGELPNPGRAGDTASLKALLPSAIAAADQALKQLKQSFEQQNSSRLRQQHERLEALKAQHQQQLFKDIEQSDQPEAFKAKRKTERQQQIDRVFQDYQSWLDNTQITENQPYLQVVAVLTGRASQ